MKNLILLLSILVISSSLTAQLNCKNYYTGYYKYSGKLENLVIYRDGPHQIEYNVDNGEWITISLNWVNDCHYTFTYVNTNMKGVEQFMGDTIEVEISNGNSDGYTYHAVYQKGEKDFHGKIVFIGAEIDKATKNKIRKKLNKTKG